MSTSSKLFNFGGEPNHTRIQKFLNIITTAERDNSTNFAVSVALTEVYRVQVLPVIELYCTTYSVLYKTAKSNSMDNERITVCWPKEALPESCTRSLFLLPSILNQLLPRQPASELHQGFRVMINGTL